mmetsp:Transcript_83783/g.175273  ORF Transcript_83783/g.175273 Transcript_83783/m.175273 type:complete len:267 (+) Transcript_83783:838-1638(+)
MDRAAARPPPPSRRRPLPPPGGRSWIRRQSRWVAASQPVGTGCPSRNGARAPPVVPAPPPAHPAQVARRLRLMLLVLLSLRLPLLLVLLLLLLLLQLLSAEPLSWRPPGSLQLLLRTALQQWHPCRHLEPLDLFERTLWAQIPSQFASAVVPGGLSPAPGRPAGDCHFAVSRPLHSVLKCNPDQPKGTPFRTQTVSLAPRRNGRRRRLATRHRSLPCERDAPPVPLTLQSHFPPEVPIERFWTGQRHPCGSRPLLHSGGQVGILLP